MPEKPNSSPLGKAGKTASRLAVVLSRQMVLRRQIARLQDEEACLAQQLVPYMNVGESRDFLCLSCHGEPVHLSLYRGMAGEESLECLVTVLDPLGGAGWADTLITPDDEEDDPKLAAVHSAADSLRTPTDHTLRP